MSIVPAGTAEPRRTTSGQVSITARNRNRAQATAGRSNIRSRRVASLTSLWVDASGCRVIGCGQAVGSQRQRQQFVQARDVVAAQQRTAVDLRQRVGER